MKAVMYERVDVRKGFMVGHQIYENDAVFTSRTDSKDQIIHGYIITHDNGYQEFLVNEDTAVDVKANMMLSDFTKIGKKKIVLIPVVGNNTVGDIDD